MPQGLGKREHKCGYDSTNQLPIIFTAAFLDLTENLTSSWQIRHPLSEAVLLLESPAPVSIAVSPPVPLKI